MSDLFRGVEGHRAKAQDRGGPGLSARWGQKRPWRWDKEGRREGVREEDGGKRGAMVVVGSHGIEAGTKTLVLPVSLLSPLLS